MKLGEALNERARLAKRVSEIRDILSGSLVVQEGEEAPANAQALMAESKGVIDNIEQLVAAINKTNSETDLDGKSLTEIIARRDALGAKISMLEFVINKLANDDPYSFRRSASELRQVRKIKLEDVTSERDNLAKQRRELDAQLQTVNWTTELLT